MFFIQDGIKFPDIIHAAKPHPDREIPQAQSAHDTSWDFVFLHTEATHHLFWHLSDRGIPRSYRTCSTDQNRAGGTGARPAHGHAHARPQHQQLLRRETEQVAFHVGHLPPAIDVTDDPLLHARLFYRSLSPVEREHIARAFTFELGKCYERVIKERQLRVLATVDTERCARVAAGLGLPAPEPTGPVAGGAG
ncbi:catalase [Actinokineospora auranticolor]|uniref:catalase n=1 Tax=Actinokineospora auranticolor TaxID=155976 RepID=A0A2S6GIB5_9PSEU|nr:catalase [Actinokineospora auranticolor]